MNYLNFIVLVKKKLIEKKLESQAVLVNTLMKIVLSKLELNYESNFAQHSFSEKTRSKMEEFFETNNYETSNIKEFLQVFDSIQDICVELSHDEDLIHPSLSTVLSSLIRNCGKSCNQISKEIGVPTATLNKWKLGQTIPSKDNIHILHELESYFGMKNNFLRFKAGYLLFGEATEKFEEANSTTNGLALKILSEDSYGIRMADWPAVAREEFEDVCTFFTQTLPRGKFLGMNRFHESFWNDGKRGGGTEIKFQSLIELFFGFLVRERGLNIATLTLGHLICPENIDGYISFKEGRRGYLSNGLKSELKTLRSLVHPEHGLFTQYQEIGTNYLISKENSVTESWDSLCKRSFNMVKAILDAGQFTTTDDEDQRIEVITHSENPCKEIAKIIDKMKFDAHLEGLSKNRLAVRYRDYLSVLLHFALIHRSHIYSELKLGEHLKKEESGKWSITIFKTMLKDGSKMADSKFTYHLPLDISKCIDTYLEIHRPNLAKIESDYLFIPSQNSNYGERNCLEPSGISKNFRKSMIYYSTVKSGFPSKAARKIISTILNNEDKDDDYIIGAIMAINSVKVNEQHYTKNQLSAAYNINIRKLQENGVLETPLSSEEIENKMKISNIDLERISFLEKLVEDLKNQNQLLSEVATA